MSGRFGLTPLILVTSCSQDWGEKSFKMASSKIPPQARVLVKHWESCSLIIYGDVANHPSIGWGHEIKLGENLTHITQQQADYILDQDLEIAMDAVLALTKVPLNDNQLAALIDFVFDVGSGHYQRSTLRMELNQGDYEGAANQFTRYDEAGGKVYKGLLTRRMSERNLFRKK